MPKSVQDAIQGKTAAVRAAKEKRLSAFFGRIDAALEDPYVAGYYGGVAATDEEVSVIRSAYEPLGYLVEVHRSIEDCNFIKVLFPPGIEAPCLPRSA